MKRAIVRSFRTVIFIIHCIHDPSALRGSRGESTVLFLLAAFREWDSGGQGAKREKGGRDVERGENRWERGVVSSPLPPPSILSTSA